MPFSRIVEALNLQDVFSFFVDSICISIFLKGVITTTLFLGALAIKTSLVVLVVLANLALVGGRLLLFITRYISEKIISILNLFEDLLLFFYRLLFLKTL